MKKFKIFLPLCLTAVILTIIYFTFYSDIDILGGLKTRYEKDEILRKSSAFLKEYNVDNKGLNYSVEIQANKSLIRQVQNEFGNKKGNLLLSSSIPGYYWNVRWDKIIRSNYSFGTGSGGDMNEITRIKLNFDTHGNLLEFYTQVNDSTEIPDQGPTEAEKKARDFVSHYYKIVDGDIADTLTPAEHSLISPNGEVLEFENEKEVPLSRRTDYEFSWLGKSKFLNDSISVTLTVAGGNVTSYKASYIVPSASGSENYDFIRPIVYILFYILIIVMVGIVAYKKIRAYEIGFKLASVVTSVVAVSLVVYLYLMITDKMGWAIIFPLVFGPLFYGGLVFMGWAAGETLTRENWNDKFNSLDLITKGYVFNSRIGRSVINGLSAGIALIILQQAFLFIAESFMPLTYSSYSSGLIDTLNAVSHSAAAISESIYHPVLHITIFMLFVMAALRKKIKSTALLLLVTGILYGLINSYEIYPYPVGLLFDIFTGVVFVWVYYKYDALTSFITISSVSLLPTAMSMLKIGNDSFTGSAYLILLVIGFIVLYGIACILSGEGGVDIQALNPAFVKNITERERLQRELEIAKEVQMSFLPRTNPEFPGIEIASRCVPALEVGGDYYDFVLINDKKIGIIIGDVSGKGTQAAFYMTLTKGFLKALSRIQYTPANFLSELNSLFYENVERGTFISIAYGILDIENKKFTLARAGHNPVIVKNSAQGKTEFLNSSGLALGLEKGLVFQKAIKEVEVPVSSGDVFVFYTDGFTEAMNKFNEEFGETKLALAVEENSGLHAEQILDNIFTEVQSFIGKADQHDDMTMVVVKVI